MNEDLDLDSPSGSSRTGRSKNSSGLSARAYSLTGSYGN